MSTLTIQTKYTQLKMDRKWRQQHGTENWQVYSFGKHTPTSSLQLTNHHFSQFIKQLQTAQIYFKKTQTKQKTEGWGHFFNFHMILFFPSAYTEKASLHFCITTFFVFPWTDDHAYNYTPTLTQTASYFWWNWPCIHLHTHIYPNSKLFLMERIMHTTAHPHLPKQQVIFDGTDHAYNCTPTIT